MKRQTYHAAVTRRGARSTSPKTLRPSSPWRGPTPYLGRQAPDAARPARSVQARKRPQTEGDALRSGAAQRKVLRAKPHPYLRVLGRRAARGGGRGLVVGAPGHGSIAPVCRAPPLGCSATTLGACFIDPYQNVLTNAETQRGGTPPWSAGMRGLGKAESTQARATRQIELLVDTFSHELAKRLDVPFAAHVCEHPSNPTSNYSPAALFLPRRLALPKIPAHGARISQSAPACLRRDGSQHPWCPS